MLKRLSYSSGQGNIDDGTTYGGGWVFRVNRENDSPIGSPAERDEFAAELVRRYNAAPELAELLLRYVEQEETAAPYSSSPLRESARAALARARGEV